MARASFRTCHLLAILICVVLGPFGTANVICKITFAFIRGQAFRPTRRAVTCNCPTGWPKDLAAFTHNDLILLLQVAPNTIILLSL